MKKNYLTKIFFVSLMHLGIYAGAQEADEPIVALDTEVETEVEVEAEAGIGQAAGVVSLAAGAGANFPNSNAAIMLSGALSQIVGVPTTGVVGPDPNNTGISKQANTSSLNSQKSISSGDVLFFLAESESEVESEVEVEVNDGAAIATAGSSVGAAGVAASKYTTPSGEVKVWPSNTTISVDAKTSVSSSVSDVNIEFKNEQAPVVSGSGEGAFFGPIGFPMETKSSYRNSGKGVQDLPYEIVYAEEGDEPVSQIETDTETEVEAEAEAEAETAPGAAAAGATGGTATSVAGDFGVAISSSSVITSVSTSEVNDEEPALFSEVEPLFKNSENTASGNENIGGTTPFTSNNGTQGFSVRGSSNSVNKANNQITASELANVPTEVNGKGLNSFESEAESEVEVEAEVDNGAASVAVIAIGGAGANGSASSVSGSSTSAASTSTEGGNGFAQRENDEIFYQDSRSEELLEAQPAASAEAEATAEAASNTAVPQANGTASAEALGDAFAFGQLIVEDIAESGLMGPVADTSTSRAAIKDYNVKGKKQSGARVAFEGKSSNVMLEGGEIEGEAEAEAEAEVGFNAAAAGAGSSAVQGKSGRLPYDSSTASSSSTSTKVFDGEENKVNENDSFTPDGATEYPDLGGDVSDYNYEVEVETEVEAEVGINSSAVAVSAAGAGYEGLALSTKYMTTPFAAAGAAAAGQTVTTSITMPAGNAAGNVLASATAEDSESRGVSVAVAVAGVPTENGVENEMEAESEGAGFATVSVSIYTDPANAQNPILIGDYASTPDFNSGQDQGGSLNDGIGEAEAEAESEAEAGYGVAAAAASAAAAGRFAVSESFTSTSTLDYDLGYEFFDNLNLITEATVTRTEQDSTIVEIKFNGFGYSSFSIQQKDTDGTFVEVGTLQRGTPDIWESYIFTINNVDPNAPQQFKIVPAEDTTDEVILTLGGSALCDDIVAIPDVTFKNLLLANTEINTNGDGEIQCFEASNYTGELVFPQSGITDLTGIESFIQVKEIDFSNNELTTVDFSENLLLNTVNLAGNNLTELNIEPNNNITTLKLAVNDLTNIVGLNDLEFLSVLDVGNNELSTLDVSNNPILSILEANNNNLTSLDLGNNAQLSVLEANGNDLTSLDLSGNPGLLQVKLRNNNLSTLDLRNGNNMAITSQNLDLENNANLTCVSVDAVSYAAANFTRIDSQTAFSNDCANPNQPNEAPNAVCKNITIALNDDGEATITAMDIDGGSFDVDSTITYEASQLVFDCTDIGEVEVTLTITDSEGLTDTCTSTVTVEEGTATLISIPEEVVVEVAEGECEAVVVIDAAVSSACGDITFTSDAPADSLYPIGTTVVTYTVTEADGTSNEFTTNVVVEDNLMPTATCLEDQVEQIQESTLYTLPDYIAEELITFTDNCGATDLTFTQTPLPGEELTGGTYTVTVEATDASGNVGSCSFELTVDATLSVSGNELSDFGLYPNPTSSQLTIVLKSNVASVDIYSMTGQLVISQKSSEKVLDVNSLAQGIYLIKITDNEGKSAVKQFVKK